MGEKRVNVQEPIQQTREQTGEEKQVTIFVSLDQTETEWLNLAAMGKLRNTMAWKLWRCYYSRIVKSSTYGLIILFPMMPREVVETPLRSSENQSWSGEKDGKLINEEERWVHMQSDNERDSLKSGAQRDGVPDPKSKLVIGDMIELDFVVSKQKKR
ncbi:hypothetical protein POUND7_020141 [Theobroma cacao]